MYIVQELRDLLVPWYSRAFSNVFKLVLHCTYGESYSPAEMIAWMATKSVVDDYTSDPNREPLQTTDASTRVLSALYCIIYGDNEQDKKRSDDDPTLHYKYSFPHRIDAVIDPYIAITIELEKPVKYPTYVGIFIDGARVHKLPLIEKGLPLRWSVDLPIDVTPQSQVSLQIKEVHRVRVWQGDLGSWILSDHANWMKYDSTGAQKEIVQQAERFTVSIRFSPPLGINDARLVAERAVKATNDLRKGVLAKLGQARSAIETIVGILEHVEEVHPIAKAALSILTKAFKFLEEEEKYDESVQDLALGMADMLSFAEAVNQHAKIAQLKDTIAQMMLMVEDASRFILDSQSSSVIGRAAMSLVSSERRNKIDEYIKHFGTLRKSFDTGVTVQILDVSSRTLKMSSKVLRVVAATEEILLGEQERLLLGQLPVAYSAGYDPSSCCMEGTRTKILQDIVDWSTQPTRSTLLWLRGPAGSGKSSIATSTAQELQRRNVLAATFFCSRDKPELRDPTIILPTLAARLAISFPAFGKAVANQLRRDPHIGKSAMQFQYEGLFASPVKEIGAGDITTRVTPLLIVIDALDECGSAETRKTLLKYLLEISRLTSWLKVVATSRPESDIIQLFKASFCTSFSLDVNDGATSDDILLFTRARMAEIVQSDDLQPSDWPGVVRTKQLAERAGGLFIWAKTASLFIKDGPDPEKRLQLILSMRSPAGAYSALDALYATALMNAFGKLDGDKLETFQQVVGTIVTSLTPLPIPAIYDLLQGRVSLVAIRKVVRNLGSVLFEDERNDSVVRVCHISFIDFMTDISRCDPQFVVDLRQHHTELAIMSLQTMLDRLRFDICDLESSDLFNDQIPDLDKRVKNAIPIPVKYSCVHWMTHLCNSSNDVPLVEALERFLSQGTVLFWIEALSLLGEIPAAIHGLPLTVGWFKDPENASSLFISDIHRFILAFKEPITRSTPHLYISAMPFVPTQSLISKRFLPLFPNTISLHDRESLWSPCFQTLEGHSGWPVGVCWSPDGQKLASGSHDNTVCIWDSTTGAMVQRLRAHSNTVPYVSFSPNSRLIASGSWDQTIQIWDAETGAPTSPPFLGHTAAIFCVIFSPDGKHLVSCSGDKTICIWDVNTGKLALDPFNGHSDIVRCIAYSPDGTRIVSASDDATVRVWDVKTGRTVLGPLTAHTDGVYTVDFPPDGRRILSGSRDSSIIIWDLDTGVMSLAPLQVGDTVTFAKFSPDGHLILSTSLDSKVRIWDAENGTALFSQEHPGLIQSACFSPNGQHFVTGSSDRTVRVWELNSLRPSTSTASDLWHTRLINSVAVSPDGKYIASGSMDETVRIWHADTGASACAPLRGHTDSIRAVTFSPDSQHILSASWDKTLRLWTVATWLGTMEPFSGHGDAIECAVFSPDGHFILSGSRDRTIRLWNPMTGKEICEPLRGHQAVVTALDISSDGRLIGSGSKDETVKIWDSMTRQNVISLFQGDRSMVWSIRFSPGNRYVASFSHYGYVRLWDIQEQILVWKIPLSASTGPGCCIFARNGRHLFCSSSSFIFTLDTQTGSIIGSPSKGHSNSIRSLAITPDRKCLISGSDDYTVRAWDIESEEDDNHQELLPDARNLVKPAGQDGWVRMETGDPLLWIPSEYRDGLWNRALFSIPPTAMNHPRTLDCSRFRHGSAWTEVQGI